VEKTRARILAIDDDASQLAAIKRALRRSHFLVDTAASGEAGLRMAMQAAPDLILLDVSMPGMSGHEFLDRYRRQAGGGSAGPPGGSGDDVPLQTPVIFLTAWDAPHQCVSGLGAGAVDYVTKPFDPDELCARIDSQLRRSRQQREQLAAAGSELERLEFCVGAALDAATECRAELGHLEACLEQAGYRDDADQQQELVARVREDIQSLSQSLTGIVKWFATKGD